METLPARIDLEEIQSLAQLMIQSKMFSDIQGVAQGAVRILAGRELGIGPVASLRSIEIVRGNLSIRSHLMAAMIKRSPRYNYRVTASTDEKCTIEFLEDGESCGTSEFTLDDAKKANLLGNDSWKKYPKMMLYNRAMSNGAKMYCPDIFLGGVFYESEIIEAEATPIIDEDPKSDEMATQKHIGVLLGLLKQYGVRDGDKRELIEFEYPDGLTKDRCKKTIDHIRDEQSLPPIWRTAYIRFLGCQHGHKNGLNGTDITKWMDDNYGHHVLGRFTHDEFLAVIDYIIPNSAKEEPGDIYMPGEQLKDVTVKDWVDFTTKICTTCQLTAKQFEQWALSQFSNGTVTDITKLPKEVYYSLTSMDDDDIKAQVMEYHSANEKQGVLVG